ncbi:MAG: hypothetical protein SOU84_05900 [Candidatus Faecimonas sp.]|nr:hypothetical protein [Mycoplasmatota bacterium]MDY2908668.1 hypothetical protein [Candidatus Faecimonas sp.]
MKKMILIIIIIVGLSLMLGGVWLTFFGNGKKPSEPKVSLEEKTRQTSKEAIASLMDSSMTPKKLKDKYGVSMGNEAILVGKSSILREKSDLEKKLTDYSKAQDYYASRVEKKIQDTFSYRLGDYLVADDGQNVIQKLYFKSYYLELYLMDLNVLQDMLLNKLNFSIYNVEGDLTEKDLKLMYKAKIKAMEIMDNHLDNYINTQEEIEYDMIYTVKDKENLGPLDYYSLVCNVSGIMYDVLTDITVQGSTNYMAQQARLEGYLSEVDGSTEQEILGLSYQGK